MNKKERRAIEKKILAKAEELRREWVHNFIAEITVVGKWAVLPTYSVDKTTLTVSYVLNDVLGEITQEFRMQCAPFYQRARSYLIINKEIPIEVDSWKIPADAEWDDYGEDDDVGDDDDDDDDDDDNDDDVVTAKLLGVEIGSCVWCRQNSKGEIMYEKFVPNAVFKRIALQAYILLNDSDQVYNAVISLLGQTVTLGVPGNRKAKRHEVTFDLEPDFLELLRA